MIATLLSLPPVREHSFPDTTYAGVRQPVRTHRLCGRTQNSAVSLNDDHPGHSLPPSRFVQSSSSASRNWSGWWGNSPTSKQVAVLISPGRPIALKGHLT